MSRRLVRLELAPWIRAERYTYAVAAAALADAGHKLRDSAYIEGDHLVIRQQRMTDDEIATARTIVGPS